MTVSPRLRVAILAATTAGFGAGCLGDAGEPCHLDSDCAGDLVCGLGGVCATFDPVAASFDAAGADTSRPDATPSSTSDAAVDVDPSQCPAPEGAFEAGTPPCPEPREVRPVQSLALASTGHGMARMAQIANNVIAEGFAEGDIALSLLVDGRYAAGCEARYVFVEDADEDILSDCTPRHVDTMPFVVPNLVRAEVYDVAIDPATDTLTGLLDKEALLASMDESLRGVADGLIDVDVDTDGDEVPDRTSVILTLSF